MTTQQDSLESIAQALFIVNRHAKTALEPKQLYHLKKHTITKLLKENRATKVGLHFSDHPKFSHQHSTLLVKVSDYYFHIPPTKEDFKTMKHLGNVDKNYRNPKPQMSLSHAKKVLSNYLNWSLSEMNKPRNKRTHSTYFTPSSLGQRIDRSPYQRRYPNRKSKPLKRDR
ncbi:YkyB family protein [Aquibacillus sediminis]|uniref:YkyB family protein n=1 Tax=Aquibacillus sediminis TaxID=2574734 RepID=UPI001107BE0B|nr:YkyB family protein [Aquibacillus sediminis]